MIITDILSGIRLALLKVEHELVCSKCGVSAKAILEGINVTADGEFQPILTYPSDWWQIKAGSAGAPPAMERSVGEAQTFRYCAKCGNEFVEALNRQAKKARGNLLKEGSDV